MDNLRLDLAVWGHICPLLLLIINYYLKLQSIATTFYERYDKYCFGKEYVSPQNFCC